MAGKHEVREQLVASGHDKKVMLLCLRCRRTFPKGSNPPQNCEFDFSLKNASKSTNDQIREADLAGGDY